MLIGEKKVFFKAFCISKGFFLFFERSAVESKTPSVLIQRNLYQFSLRGVREEG